MHIPKSTWHADNCKFPCTECLKLYYNKHNRKKNTFLFYKITSFFSWPMIWDDTCFLISASDLFHTSEHSTLTKDGSVQAWYQILPDALNAFEKLALWFWPQHCPSKDEKNPKTTDTRSASLESVQKQCNTGIPQSCNHDLSFPTTWL